MPHGDIIDGPMITNLLNAGSLVEVGPITSNGNTIVVGRVREAWFFKNHHGTTYLSSTDRKLGKAKQ